MEDWKMHGHVYTEEEHAFMREFVPGHSYRETASAFTEKFGREISISQVKAYTGNHHLNTGRTGRFQKGHVPPNKGKKGACAAGCEKAWFPKGHIPKNHRPAGSERVNIYGYAEVKVAEPDKWGLKHRIVWEKANGPVPEGYIIIFRDNNRTNTDINNLLMIKRGIHAVMNRTGLCGCSGEFKDTAVKIAELKSAAGRARKRRKP